MICPECSKEIEENILYCPNCGYQLKDEDRIGYKINKIKELEGKIAKLEFEKNRKKNFFNRLEKDVQLEEYPKDVDKQKQGFLLCCVCFLILIIMFFIILAFFLRID